MKYANEVKVWDPFVRGFHWVLVASFFTAYLAEDEMMGLHIWAGYLAFSLVVLRLLWGFVGTENARFRNFVFGPAKVLSHLRGVLSRQAPRYLGHNPAGGAMIVALLAGLLLTGLTGMAVFGGETGSGPLGAWAGMLGATGERGHEAFEDIHEFFANLTLFLVMVHVGGVVWESIHHRENLIRSMFTGRKRA